MDVELPPRGAPSRRDELRRRLSLMVLTTPRPACGRSLLEVVERCLRAGAPSIQLRDKEASAAKLLDTARRLAELVRGYGALLLVNDRFDVALAAGAHGVHLGPEDLPVESVRAVVPPEFVIGASTDDPATGRRLAVAGADYLGVGAVYGTRSKPGLEGEAIGPGRVAEIEAAADLTCVGIGGITPENVAAVAARGAGAAVLGAVMDADRPEEEVRRLLEAIDRASGEAGARSDGYA